MKDKAQRLLNQVVEGLGKGKDTVTTQAGQITTAVGIHATAIKNAVTDGVTNLVQLDAVAASLKQLSELTGGASIYADKILGPLMTSDEAYGALLGQLSKLHNHASENPVIRATIDRLAHTPGYGGAGFHRISDGRHSIQGALEAVAAELPEIPAMERIAGSFSHLWHDFHSAVGIPIISFANHEAFRSFCDGLHLSPGLVQDVLAINSTELLGSALAILPTLFRLDEMQAADFARVAGRMGILTVAGGQAEIIGSLFALAMLGKAFFEAHHEGESVAEVLVQAAKEGGWTAASVASFALLPLPVSVSLAVALPILRAKVEANGLDATLTEAHEYFGSLIQWIQDGGLSRLKGAVA